MPKKIENVEVTDDLKIKSPAETTEVEVTQDKVKPISFKAAAAIICRPARDTLIKQEILEEQLMSLLFVKKNEKVLPRRDMIRAILKIFYGYLTHSSSEPLKSADEVDDKTLLNYVDRNIGKLDYFRFVYYAIRECYNKNDILHAQVAKFFATCSNIAPGLVRQNFAPRVKQHVSQLATRSVHPKTRDDRVMDDRTLAEWLGKAPNYASSDAYFISKFMFYLPGFVVDIKDGK